MDDVKKRPRGNCYATCEALWHLLGGSGSQWQPMNVRHEGDSHWFLRHRGWTDIVLDPTRSQFKTPVPYRQARGRGFLTKSPSKRACELMARMVWQ